MMLSRKFIRIFAYVVLIVMLFALIAIAIAIDVTPSDAHKMTVEREATLRNFEPIGGSDDGSVRAFNCQRCSLFLSGSWTIKQTTGGIVLTPRL